MIMNLIKQNLEWQRKKIRGKNMKRKDNKHTTFIKHSLNSQSENMELNKNSV